eukprot:CAMPEP_0178948842 /NCGR_PEP_ID=MMETSP0789-20121207/5701_1 /TAXON_ID=3005 /ORGANISM="Rhizosolenia setigera, Strain CCMP 1694" /LENGTH=1083 /DNA_ID=CAMNT_0020629261 /DNA_START=85 /DNA_END=3333 /DNA_ORIENTATION=-
MNIVLKYTSILLIFFLYSSGSNVLALYEEDVGISDFLISTAGHPNGVNYATFDEENAEIVVTSGEGSCYISGRATTTTTTTKEKEGTLIWRRNACGDGGGGKGSTNRIASIDSSNNIVATLAYDGILRGWDLKDGSLLYDVNLGSAVISTTASSDDDGSSEIHMSGNLLLVSHNQTISVYDIKTGEPILRDVQEQLPYKKSKKHGKAAFHKVIATISGETNDKVYALIGLSIDSDATTRTTTSLSNMAVLEFTSNEITENTSFQIKNPTQLLVSSFKLYFDKNSGNLSLLGISQDQSSVLLVSGILSSSSSSQHQNALKVLDNIDNSIESVDFINSSIISLKKEGGVVKLYPIESDATSSSSVSETLQSSFSGATSCNKHLITLTDEKMDIYSLETLQKLNSIALNLHTETQGSVTNLYSSCSSSSHGRNQLLITTTGGTSLMISLDKDMKKVVNRWEEEEALASTTRSILMDSSLLYETDENNEENYLQDELFSFTHRLSLQLKSLQPTWVSHNNNNSGGADIIVRKNQRDVKFGFAKIAVLFSSQKGRLFGLNTLEKGKVVWSLLLNPLASFHKIVHGGASSSQGIEGGLTQSQGTNEFLSLSYFAEKIEYQCIDGLRGRVIASGELELKDSKVIQTVPVRARAAAHSGKTGGSCKQIALLLHENNEISMIPPDHSSDNTNSSPDNLYTHAIDYDSGLVKSFLLGKSNAQVVGELNFGSGNEKIVEVAYPNPGEVVQSPATILGDDSLLLKYLNPHIMVIVTHIPDDGDEKEKEEKEDPFASALLSESSGSGLSSKKKKPVGVTTPSSSSSSTVNENSSSTSTPKPNLFINVVDSVSSKILYRVSHSYYSGSHSPAVPVSISENWIVYSYFNQNSKRNEIGVLTLHEGMIDKFGITMFKSEVQQELDFSSFASEKPIVLHKIYTLGQPKGIHAIGVTQTTRGIASKQFLMALNSNQIISVDRRFLDPRRPSGDPKQSEKQEGLIKYSPIVPMIPQKTLSYFQTVEDVKNIQSAPAHVESSSLILGYGGPDIFFTRVSPSKGFDMLPENFNKGLLGVVVLGLLAVLVTLQNMNRKKSMGIYW